MTSHLVNNVIFGKRFVSSAQMSEAIPQSTCQPALLLFTRDFYRKPKTCTKSHPNRQKKFDFQSVWIHQSYSELIHELDKQSASSKLMFILLPGYGKCPLHVFPVKPNTNKPSAKKEILSQFLAKADQHFKQIT